MHNHKTTFNMKIFISKSKLEEMRNANIIHFLYWWNDDLLIMDRGSFRYSKDGSITLFNNLAYDHSGKVLPKAVNTLDFTIKFITKGDFRKAAVILYYFLRSDQENLAHEIEIKYSKSSKIHSNTTEKEQEEIIMTFEVSDIFNYPRKYNDWIYWYLHNYRAIDRKIVTELLARKLLAFDESDKNLIFLTYDCENSDGKRNIISLEKKGTKVNKSFSNVNGTSNTPFLYALDGVVYSTANKLYVFESTIDLLSFITLNNAELDSIYLSTRGAGKIKCITKFIEKYPNVTEIISCVDNDEAGWNMTSKINRLYGGTHTIIYSYPPSKKDWNEHLQSLMLHTKKQRTQTELQKEEGILKDDYNMCDIAIISEEIPDNQVFSFAKQYVSNSKNVAKEELIELYLNVIATYEANGQVRECRDFVNKEVVPF